EPAELQDWPHDVKALSGAHQIAQFSHQHAGPPGKRESRYLAAFVAFGKTAQLIYNGKARQKNGHFRSFQQETFLLLRPNLRFSFRFRHCPVLRFSGSGSVISIPDLAPVLVSVLFWDNCIDRATQLRELLTRSHLGVDKFRHSGPRRALSTVFRIVPCEERRPD